MFELLGRIGDIGLQLYAYLNNVLINFSQLFYASNLRLDSKQLVSEFLRDALSTNMRH